MFEGSKEATPPCLIPMLAHWSKKPCFLHEMSAVERSTMPISRVQCVPQWPITQVSVLWKGRNQATKLLFLFLAHQIILPWQCDILWLWAGIIIHIWPLSLSESYMFLVVYGSFWLFMAVVGNFWHTFYISINLTQSATCFLLHDMDVWAEEPVTN